MELPEEIEWNIIKFMRHPAADAILDEISFYNSIEWPPELKNEVPCFHEIVFQKFMCYKMHRRLKYNIKN